MQKAKLTQLGHLGGPIALGHLGGPSVSLSALKGLKYFHLRIKAYLVIYDAGSVPRRASSLLVGPPKA